MYIVEYSIVIYIYIVCMYIYCTNNKAFFYSILMRKKGLFFFPGNNQSYIVLESYSRL